MDRSNVNMNSRCLLISSPSGEILMADIFQNRFLLYGGKYSVESAQPHSKCNRALEHWAEPIPKYIKFICMDRLTSQREFRWMKNPRWLTIFCWFRLRDRKKEHVKWAALYELSTRSTTFGFERIYLNVAEYCDRQNSGQKVGEHRTSIYTISNFLELAIGNPRCILNVWKSANANPKMTILWNI